MDDALAKRVRAAACAGWATVVLFWAIMLVSWLAVMWMLNAQPKWVLDMLGGEEMTWGKLQVIYVWAYTVWKLIMLMVLVVTVWLTFWARRLKKLEA